MIALRTKSDVTADPEIRQDHIAHPAPAVDQIGGATHAYSQGTVHAIHFYDGFLLIRQQNERQLILGLELGMGFRAAGG